MIDVNVRVAISGASGRMGRQLIRSFLSDNNFRLTMLGGVITNNNSKFIGCDIGTLIGNQSVGITVNSSIESIRDDFDVLIDFSSSEATLKYLNFCNIHNKNMVIGTTGFKKEELFLIEEASKNIGIVFSPNFSVMMTLMLKLLEKSACVIGNESDIEIFDMHHRNKRDMPSGTAVKMEKILRSASSINNMVNQSTYFSEEKGECNVKINSIRAGDIIGEHSVFFINIGERLEIVHRAFNRAVFADGAIRSAIWLGKNRIGLFDMNDVLGL